MPSEHRYTKGIFRSSKDGTVEAELTDVNGTTTFKRFGTDFEAAELAIRLSVVSWANLEGKKGWKMKPEVRS